MSESSQSDSTPPAALIFSGGDWDIVMTPHASAIAFGDEEPLLLQNPN